MRLKRHVILPTGAAHSLISAGASMQIAEAKSKVSYPIGCVRGKDIALQNSGKTDCDDDFETQRTAINRYMDEIIGTPNRRLGKCAGIGGTITTLAALSLGMREYDRDEMERLFLIKSEVESVDCRIKHNGQGKKTESAAQGKT